MNTFLILLGIFSGMGALALILSSLRARRTTTLRPVGMGLLAVSFFLIVVGASLVSAAPNERMVVFNRVSGNLGDPKGPGLHFINPLTTSYKIYDLSRQTYTMSAVTYEGDLPTDDAVPARTSDGQEVFIDLTIIYNINPDGVNDLHQKWPNDRYRTELIRPLMRSVVRDVVSEFPVESVYQERATIDSRITETIESALSGEGLMLVDILVRNVTFTDEYAQAIENAQVAEVRIREEEFRIQEVENQAKQVEARAEGVANARVIEAEGEAKALQLIADVIEDNPDLLQYQYIVNLSDNVQIIALPADSPYIFDFPSLMQPAAESTEP